MDRERRGKVRPSWPVKESHEPAETPGHSPLPALAGEPGENAPSFLATLFAPFELLLNNPLQRNFGPFVGGWDRMSKGERNGRGIVGLALILVCVAFFFAVERVWFLARMTQTTGRVVRTRDEPSARPNMPPTKYATIVFRSADGAAHQFESPSELRVGNNVAVGYATSDPSDARILADLWGASLLLLLIAAFLASFAIMIASLGRLFAGDPLWSS